MNEILLYFIYWYSSSMQVLHNKQNTSSVRNTKIGNLKHQQKPIHTVSVVYGGLLKPIVIFSLHEVISWIGVLTNAG